MPARTRTKKTRRIPDHDILAILDRHQNRPCMQALIWVLYDTGFPIGEALSLSVGSVRFENHLGTQGVNLSIPSRTEAHFPIKNMRAVRASDLGSGYGFANCPLFVNEAPAGSRRPRAPIRAYWMRKCRRSGTASGSPRSCRPLPPNPTPKPQRRGGRPSNLKSTKRTSPLATRTGDAIFEDNSGIRTFATIARILDVLSAILFLAFFAATRRQNPAGEEDPQGEDQQNVDRQRAPKTPHNRVGWRERHDDNDCKNTGGGTANRQEHTSRSLLCIPKEGRHASPNQENGRRQ
jgi:hypothetical protein